MCTAERIAALQARITAFDTAIADFALGKTVVELTYDGETVKYTPTNLPAMREQMTRDKIELARCQGQSSGYGRTRMRY